MANTSQFDATPAITLATPAPEMAGFEFSSFTLVAQGLLDIGLVPQSPPNVLGYGLLSNLQNLFSPHIISRKNNGSNFNCFDLESFYWGCKIFDPATQSTPATGCEITVTPYDTGNVAKMPYTVTFAYPGGLTEGLSVAMQLVDLGQRERKDDFRCLSKVQFSDPVAQDPVATILATSKVVQIDSVQVKKVGSWVIRDD